jgi:hypothetical protein
MFTSKRKNNVMQKIYSLCAVLFMFFSLSNYSFAMDQGKHVAVAVRQEQGDQRTRPVSNECLRDALKITLGASAAGVSLLAAYVGLECSAHRENLTPTGEVYCRDQGMIASLSCAALCWLYTAYQWGNLLHHVNRGYGHYFEKKKKD